MMIKASKRQQTLWLDILQGRFSAYAVPFAWLWSGTRTLIVMRRELACLAKTESEHVMAGQIRFSDDLFND